MPDSDSQRSEFIYRGVHARHPAHEAALSGIVFPGDLHGTITPEQHNLGDSSAFSPYTSWTHCREIAVNFALSRGGGGILLYVPIGTPRTEDAWRWEYSPDAWMEQEVLLHGIRIGVGVTRL